MGLDSQIRLEKLKEQARPFEEKISSDRRAHRLGMIQAVNGQAKTFLEEKGFTVTDVRGVIKGKLGSIEISMAYPSPDDNFFGADSVFQVQGNGKKVAVGASLRGEYPPSFPGGIFTSPGQKTDSEIKFYEDTYLPALEAMEPLTGEFSLSVRDADNPRKQKSYESVSSVIEEVFN